MLVIGPQCTDTSACVLGSPTHMTQDNFEHKDMAAAVIKHESRHTRRLDLRKFQAGARDMSLGLNLRLSEANIKDLFSQADSDKVFSCLSDFAFSLACAFQRRSPSLCAAAQRSCVSWDLQVSALTAKISTTFLPNQDGYITFLDALRALRSKSSHWERAKRNEFSRNGTLPVETQRWNRAMNQVPMHALEYQCSTTRACASGLADGRGMR